jgi:hypothetical protein
MNFLAALPDEILFQVAASLSVADLLNLLLISKDINIRMKDELLPLYQLAL